MYVVCVIFDIAQDRMEAFLPLMLQQATNSLELEGGCLVFDVCRPEAGTDTVFLYEKYVDEAAFQTHLQSAHFKSFDAQTADMVTGKSVICYHTV